MSSPEHPAGTRAPALQAVADAVAAAAECAQACTGCADACLADPAVADLRAVIRLTQDCADICTATGRVLTRMAAGVGDHADAQLDACARACAACAEACERHADRSPQCAACAEACRRCAQACLVVTAARHPQGQ